MAPNRTTVLIDGKRYDVVWDAQGVIRVEYKNSVMGMRPILFGSRKSKQVLKAFAEHRARTDANSAR